MKRRKSNPASKPAAPSTHPINGNEEEVGSSETEPKGSVLQKSIESSGLAVVLNEAFGENSYKSRLRIQNESRWLNAVLLILKEEGRTDAWNVHICRQFILHDDRMMHTWNFVVQSHDLEQALSDIVRVFDFVSESSQVFRMEQKRKSASAPKKNVELDSYPLYGCSADRNKPGSEVLNPRSSGKKKGAYYTGT